MQDSQYLNIGLLISFGLILINLMAFIMLPIIISKVMTFKVRPKEQIS